MAHPLDGLRRVAADRTWGASELVAAAAEEFAALSPDYRFEGIEILLGGHPEMAPLWHLCNEVLEGRSGDFAALLAAETAAIALTAAPLLHGIVLTHSYSGTAVRSIVRAAPMKVLCTHSEPGGEGRMTAEALRAAGLDVEVVADDAVGEVDFQVAVIGADAVTPAGVTNKVGTAAVADAARARGAMSLVLAGAAKLMPVPLPVPEPFEMVPITAFTAIVTEDGVHGEEEVLAEAAQVKLNEALIRRAARAVDGTT